MYEQNKTAATNEAMLAVAGAIVEAAKIEQSPSSLKILAEAATMLVEADKMASAGEVLQNTFDPSDNVRLRKSKRG